MAMLDSFFLLSSGASASSNRAGQSRNCETGQNVRRKFRQAGAIFTY